MATAGRRLLEHSALLLALAETAPADWNGNATGPATVTGVHQGCTTTSTLAPEPAIQMDDCDWLHNALDAHDFDADHGWAINFAADLPGTITICDYFAWVITRPQFQNPKGDLWPPKGPDCWGGAMLALRYDIVPPDPTIHWIQVIRTDCPGRFGKAKGYDEPNTDYYQYLDIAGNPKSPFYSGEMTGAAGSRWFIDVPGRRCCGGCDVCGGTCHFEAQVFACTGNLALKQLTIYDDGVWWGFNVSCVPEPATLSLTLLGALSALRRRTPH